MNPKTPSTAMRLLASFGLGLGLPSLLSKALAAPAWLPPVPVHTVGKLRRAQRKLCRELGKRQYRRQTRRAYSLRDSQAVG